MNKVEGYKTYIACALGALVVIANHLGLSIPGITVDDSAFAVNMWAIITAAAIRHGITTSK
jgi:hypothetical protein